MLPTIASLRALSACSFSVFKINYHLVPPFRYGIRVSNSLPPGAPPFGVLPTIATQGALELTLIKHTEQAQFAGLNQEIFAHQNDGHAEEFLDPDHPVAGLGQ